MNVVKKILVPVFTLAAITVGGGAAAAGDPAAGKLKSGACAACHGQTGVSNQDIWPSLAGQRAAYLVKQLRDYRGGTRKDPVMEPVAKLLTDTDINNLAAYFSTQPPPPPQPASAAFAPPVAPQRGAMPTE